MKTILLIHHCKDIGGAGLSLLRTAEMASEQYRVILALPADSPLAELAEEKGFTVEPYRFPIGTVDYYSGGPRIFSRTYLRRFLRRNSFSRNVRDMVRRLRPDLCLLNSLTLSYLVPKLRKAGVKTGVFVRETFPDRGSSVLLSRYRRWLNGADCVFFLSDFDRNFFRLSSPSYTLRNSADGRFFRAFTEVSPEERAKTEDNAPLRVLFVGGIDEIKGIRVLSEASRLCSENVRFLLAGDSREKMEPYFSHLGDRARYFGRVSDVLPCYRQADVLVFPSVYPHQARPAFEAGALGIPVVMTDFPQTGEEVQNGVNGRTFPCGDAPALAAILDELAKNPEALAYLGKNNREHALGKHSPEAARETLFQALEKTLRPRVLFLTNVPSPYRVDFFNEFAKETNLTVSFERSAANTRDPEWFARSPKNFAYRIHRGIPLGEDQAYCPGILRFLRKNPADAILVSGYSSPTAMSVLSYLKRKKIPYFLSSDGGLIHDNGTGLKFALKKHFIRGAAGYLSTSNATDRYLVHYGADPDKLLRYPFTSLFEADLCEAPASPEEKKKLRRELGLPEDKPLALTVGRFIPGKRMEDLIDAGALLPDCHIVLVGGDPTPEYLEQTQKLGLQNVAFVGFLPKEKLFRYFRAADLFVMPTETDVWGLVINEAMAAGLPVVSTDRCVAAVTLVQEGRNGYLTPVRNPEALARSMNLILSLPEDKRQEMGRQSLCTIRRYTYEEMVRVHLKYLPLLIKE